MNPQQVETLVKKALTFSEESPQDAKEKKLKYGIVFGVFRMNMVGVHFNNSNWPYIVRVGRLWSVLSAILFPILYLIGNEFFPEFWRLGGVFVQLILCLGTLFIPLYVVAKKYE